MAKKPAGEPSEKGKRRTKAANGAGEPAATDGKTTSPGEGHNIVVDFDKMKGFFERLDRLHDQMSAATGEFMSDIKKVKEESSNELGVSRKVFGLHYGKHRSELKFSKKLAELEPSEKDDIVRLMATAVKFGPDTPFGAWCASQATVKD